jgi:hypothetical protein
MNQKSSNTGVINIHGRDYQTVALRVTNFRSGYPNHSLITEILSRDEEWVVMVAKILDEAGRVIATGHAEEHRKASQINKTSALENCETSAIGRALAAFGIGGTEFASANEVQNAVHQQEAPQTPPPAKHNAAILAKFTTVRTMDELGALWQSLTADQRRAHADVKDKRKAELNAAADNDQFRKEMDEVA